MEEAILFGTLKYIDALNYLGTNRLYHQSHSGYRE